MNESPSGRQQEAAHCETDGVFVLLLHNQFSKREVQPNSRQLYNTYIKKNNKKIHFDISRGGGEAVIPGETREREREKDRG